MDQEVEIEQLELEGRIDTAFAELYELLLQSDRIEGEEALGMVAEAQAVWQNDEGSFGNE